MSVLAQQLASELEARGGAADVFQEPGHWAAVWLDGRAFCTCGWRMDVPGLLEVRALATRFHVQGAAA